jgi:hypothetical protein
MGTATQPNPKPNPFTPKPVMPQPTIQKPQMQVFPQNQPIPQAQPAQIQPTQKPQTQNLKKKNKILPVFILLCGILFLIGYAFFWIKIFNLNLPFLPF